jgi:hypothetical protein
MDTKTKLIFSTTLALFLVAGVLGGVILDRKILMPVYMQQAQVSAKPETPPAQRPPKDANSFDPLDNVANRMTKELSLDASQQKQLRVVLKKYKDKFESLREDIKGKFNVLDLELSADTMKILTDDQKKLFAQRFVRWPKPEEQQQGPGGKRPPPQESFAACKGKTTGADCSFNDRNGNHKGKCGSGAKGKNEFLCVPKD